MAKWNGSGACTLSEKRLRELAEIASNRAQESNSGWPKCYQGKKWDRATLEACTDEWSRLMLNSKYSQTKYTQSEIDRAWERFEGSEL